MARQIRRTDHISTKNTKTYTPKLIELQITLNGTVGTFSTIRPTKRQQFGEFQVGMNAGQTISVDFGNFTNVSGSGTFADFVSAGATAGTISANSTTVAQTNASAALSSIDTALTAISNQRATFGAV